jgi:hypothetical protein
LQTTRINNISLFVTVLSACLLAVGAPAQACAKHAPSAGLFSIVKENREGVDADGQEDEGLLYKIAFIRPVTEFTSDLRTSAQAFTENTRALNVKHCFLVVTNLPRAALDKTQAEQPALN